ncbi:hypothetical protein V8E52_011375, partial [Russula decolorans]
MTRTRHSQAKDAVNARSNENADVQSVTNHLQTGQKRTLNVHKESSTTAAAEQGTSDPRRSKRARITGPTHGHPLQLDLGDGDGEMRGLVEANNNKDKGKRPPPLKRTTSFYPGRETITDTVLSHLPSRIGPGNEHLVDINDGETDIESENDWFTEPPPMEPAGRTSSKASEAMLVERAIWESSPPDVGSVAANVASVTASDDVATSQEDIRGSDAPTDPVITSGSSEPSFPAETELLFVSGSNKIMLTVQCLLMRAVFQEAFERIRADMVFKNAFPNIYETIEMITDSLIKAAESNDRATNIYNRLALDADYSNNMSRLPRARVPLFRGEVKDHCAAIIQAEFLAIWTGLSVIHLVNKELSNYNYTFPRLNNGNQLNFLPRQTRPYRNIRIINVIRDLYFGGGAHSFVNRFCSQFPVHQGNDGVVLREVPIAMVALVATALYAAIQEWRTGVQRSVEFSTNAYLDVYNGHVNTFNHIRLNREESFHTMMTDIYRQA